MTPTISLTNVVKTFGATRALDGLDLSVAPGDVQGFLGPNGSGKTVAIRILLGLLRHDSGDVRLFDGEIIDLLTRLRGGPHGGTDRRRRGDLIVRFRLDPRKKSRTYSKGNRQKVALVAAMTRTSIVVQTRHPVAAIASIASVHNPRLEGDRLRFDVDLFAGILDLPQRVRNISPFEHAPTLPGGRLDARPLDARPLVALTLLAAALITVGVEAFRRRDITAGSR